MLPAVRITDMHTYPKEGEATIIISGQLAVRVGYRHLCTGPMVTDSIYKEKPTDYLLHN